MNKITIFITMASVVDARIHLPCNIGIYGPSGAGKTTFLLNLLQQKEKHFSFKGTIQNILYCYGSSEQPIFDEFKEMGVKFYKGIPDQTTLDKFFNYDGDTHHIIIIDDLMKSFSKNGGELMTKGRHNNITTITIEQNLYHQGKDSVTIRRNTHVQVIFSFRQDINSVKQTIKKSADTINDAKEIIDFYNDIMAQNPHGYLVIDLHNKTDPKITYRTNILVQEKEPMFSLTLSKDLVS